MRSGVRSWRFTYYSFDIKCTMYHVQCTMYIYTYQIKKENMRWGGWSWKFTSVISLCRQQKNLSSHNLPECAFYRKHSATVCVFSIRKYMMYLLIALLIQVEVLSNRTADFIIFITSLKYIILAWHLIVHRK